MEKALKISTDSCKRLKKEVGAYGAEAAKQEQKIASMRAANADEHDVRKQEEVLAETRRMVPDCEKRLALAVEKLRAQVGQVESNEDDDVKLTVTYTNAVEFLSTL
jgi:tubulin-specific chaperone A